MTMFFRLLFLAGVFFIASCSISDPSESGLSTEEIEAQNELEIAQWAASNPTVDVIRTSSGLAYAIFEEGNGVFPELEDIVTINFDLFLGDGTAFASTGVDGLPIEFPLNSFVPGLIEGLQLLSPGGRGVFLIPSDLGFENHPDGIEDDDLLIYVVDFIDINGQFASELENQAIEAYLTDNNLVPDTITDSGLRMIFLEEGNGNFPTETSMVEVDYHGTLLNGTIFDTTRERAAVTLGLDMVIEGWQEGIPLLSEGASAIMILPPTIAYGSNSPSAIIPPNSTLVFEVTLNAIL